jgi:SNF2 family DNA or RNA helicase
MGLRGHIYMRLDGSSKISDRRDMVSDFQSRLVAVEFQSNIFGFVELVFGFLEENFWVLLK